MKIIISSKIKIANDFFPRLNADNDDQAGILDRDTKGQPAQIWRDDLDDSQEDVKEKMET